jgi:putative intracellular protease/amidase
MRPSILNLSLLLAGLIAAAPDARCDEAGRVFLFVRDGSRDLDRMLTQEVGVMRTMLEDAGYIVDIATADGAPMVSENASLEPTIALEYAEVTDYDGIVLPCMAPAAGHPMPARVDILVAEAVELGIPIAASRGSVTTLALAGGLNQRRYAYAGPVDPAERPEFLGGTYAGTGVVRDGGISTAGICPLAAHELGEPDGTAELMRAFIASLGDKG